MDIATVSAEATARSGIRTAELERSAPTDDLTEVVATVNGQPIFASEVLERYAVGLENMKQQAPPKLFAQKRTELLMQELPAHIEQTMLNQKLREKFGGEVVANVEQELDGMFADQIATLKQKTGAKTLRELEGILHENKTSIGSQKRAFANQQLAAFYLSQTLDEVPDVRRQDIVARYNDEIAKYTQPADVKWQQLTVSFEANNGRLGALQTLEKAVAELKAGESFDVVIGRHSDGPMRGRAGMWDYVTRGSLTNAELEERLFSLDVGEISAPIQTDRSFLIVRVADRRDERRTPLKEVQDAIKTQIANERRGGKAEQMIASLWADATVTTPFDDDPRWQRERADRAQPDSDRAATAAASAGRRQ